MPTTCSCPVIGSWSRCSRPGSHSTTATLRLTLTTSSLPNQPTSGRRRKGCIPAPPAKAASTSRSRPWSRRAPHRLILHIEPLLLFGPADLRPGAGRGGLHALAILRPHLQSARPGLEAHEIHSRVNARGKDLLTSRAGEIQIAVLNLDAPRLAVRCQN